MMLPRCIRRRRYDRALQTYCLANPYPSVGRFRDDVDRLRKKHGFPPVAEGRWGEMGAPWSGL